MDTAQDSQIERASRFQRAWRLVAAGGLAVGSFIGIGGAAEADVQPGETIDQACTEESQSIRIIQDNVQTFTAGKSPLTGIEILYDNSRGAAGSGQNDVVRSAELREGDPKGPVLATSELREKDNVTRKWARIPFNSVTLTPGNLYAIRVFWPDGPQNPSFESPGQVFCNTDYAGGDGFSRPKPTNNNPDPPYTPNNNPDDLAFLTITPDQQATTTTTEAPTTTSTSTSSTTSTTAAPTTTSTTEGTTTTTEAPATSTSTSSTTVAPATTSTTAVPALSPGETGTTTTTRTNSAPTPTQPDSPRGVAGESLPRTGSNIPAQTLLGIGLVLGGIGLTQLDRQPQPKKVQAGLSKV